MSLSPTAAWWIVAICLMLIAVLRYWLGRNDEEPSPAPDRPRPYIPAPWPAADSDAEQAMRAALTSDLEEFERVALPVFQRAGYSKDAALVVWWLRDLGHNLIEVELAIRASGDDPEERREPWQR